MIFPCIHIYAQNLRHLHHFRHIRHLQTHCFLCCNVTDYPILYNRRKNRKHRYLSISMYACKYICKYTYKCIPIYWDGAYILQTKPMRIPVTRQRQKEVENVADKTKNFKKKKA